MYFVDRTLLEKRLQYMEKLLKAFRSQNEWADPLEKLAMERIAHCWLEAMIDVGNQMIDGFIMRDPGGYSDIINILDDEKVIGEQTANALKAILAWRKTIVNDYLNINHGELEATIREQEREMEYFPNAVRVYLEEELGSVSAFLPDER